MDILIAVLMLIIGLIAGYFIAKVQFDGKQNQRGAAAETELKALMKAHTTRHINESRKMADSLEQKVKTLREQIDTFENGVNMSSEGSDKEQLAFFGEHTSVFLRNNVSSDKTSADLLDADIQPRDFSNQSSGLFQGDIVDSSKTNN